MHPTNDPIDDFIQDSIRLQQERLEKALMPGVIEQLTADKITIEDILTKPEARQRALKLQSNLITVLGLPE